MNKIYISEPDYLNMHIVKELLTGKWNIVEGTPAFEGSNVKDCSAVLIRSATAINASIKNIFPQLKHIVRVGVGIDNIDIDYCNRKGIAIYNAPGANADAASDYVIGMMLMALRKIYLLSKSDIKKWDRFKFTGHSLAGRTIGIIGFGNIGKQVFSKLQSFNCKEFFVYDPLIKKDDMPEGVRYVTSTEEVLQKSDIVTLHVPLLASTKYLINKKNLSIMPKGAILINASRGGIVNESDLLEHIRDHDLVYVADTVEGEPHVSDDLLNAASVLITPHIASLTEEAEVNMITTALDNFLNERPVNKPTSVTV